jgi:hypothetical protein
MLQPMGGLPWATSVNQSNLAQAQAPSDPPASATNTDFATQLENAIEGVVAKSGNGSQFDINVKTGQGPDANQFTITVTDIGQVAGSSGSLGAPGAAGSSGSGAAAASGGSSPFTPAQLATMTPADAYWEAQPPAVQQLRYMMMDQRGGYAEEMAAEGYKIDVPIMVDGGDPLAVMIQRMEDGYTWVPSALMQNIPAGPGIMDTGAIPYDAKNPPAGSIIVSTAFALGTNIAADPVVSAQDAKTYVLDPAGASLNT